MQKNRFGIQLSPQLSSKVVGPPMAREISSSQKRAPIYSRQLFQMYGCLGIRTAAHSIEEVAHAAESEIQFYSPRCTASFGEKCLTFLVGPMNIFNPL